MAFEKLVLSIVNYGLDFPIVTPIAQIIIITKVNMRFFFLSVYKMAMNAANIDTQIIL